MSTAKSRDLQRYERLRALGCVACLIGNYKTQCGPTEIHHLVDKGTRKHSGGNQASIPLGQYHHQGIPFMDKTVTFMREVYGPSLRLESKAFTELYGTQRALLARVNALL
jgi:hypothetical protein